MLKLLTMKISIIVLILCLFHLNVLPQTFQIEYDDVNFIDIKRAQNGYLYGYSMETTSSVNHPIFTKHYPNGEVIDFVKFNFLDNPIYITKHNRFQFLDNSTIMLYCLYIDTAIGAAYQQVMNISENLDLIWAKTYQIGLISDIVSYNNRAIVVCSNATCGGPYYIGVTNIDNTGNYHWAKGFYYEDSLDFKGSLIAKTPKLKFLITNHYGDTTKSFLMIDSLGNALWDRVYRFPGHKLTTNSFKSDGDEFICLGSITGDSIGAIQQPFFMKLDSVGNITHFKIYNFDIPSVVINFQNIINHNNQYYITGYVSFCPLFISANYNGDIQFAYKDISIYATFNGYTGTIESLDNENILIAGKSHLTVLDTLGQGFCNSNSLTFSYINPVPYFEEFSHNLFTYNFSILPVDSTYIFTPTIYNSNILCYNNPIDIEEQYNHSKELIIYPNPTTGKITIQAKNIEKIKVLNITGKVIKNLQGFGNLEGLEIDLSQNPKGIYIIKVTTSKGVMVEKVVLE